MLRILFNQFVPRSLHGGDTAYPTLSRIDSEMRACDGIGAAVAVLDRNRPGLYDCLRRAFPDVAAQALSLKILNLFLARYHFQARSTRLLSRPFGLVVDPSNMCQLACPGCVHSERSELLKIFDWRKGTLPEDRMSALLKQYGPYAIGVYFCNYGEPLLNLNTPKLIRLAKGYLMWTALSTSLSVQRFDAEAYVESGLDFMVLSIDGATQPVYERFRRNGKLDLVLDNIRKLVAAKRKAGRRTPVLSWNFLAFEHNRHEIAQAKRLARSLGVNVFRIVNPFDVRWDDEQIRPAAVRPGIRRFDLFSMSSLPENWNPSPEAVDAPAISGAFERPWRTEGPPESGNSPGHTCHWLYKNMVMDATGRIMPCCGAPRPDADLVFSNFDGESDPFNSAKYRQARLSFAGNSHSSGEGLYCTRCEWDHTAVNIGEREIRRYFRGAHPAFFDRRSLRLLSSW
jgi:MoaA/NifB/PqqE/SkfB family radical SAM enzyme